EGSSIISVDLSTDYLCGDDIEYHFIGEYCYKINLHETNWAEEKSQCQHDNAIYTSSGIVNIGVIYDNQTSMKIQNNANDGKTSMKNSISPVIHNIGERVFDE
ncbi:unnamed protein product, partial [Rotaria magnacalcarata]